MKIFFALIAVLLVGVSMQAQVPKAADVLIETPAFNYFNDMVLAGETNTLESTYACFEDRPLKFRKDDFQLIRVWDGTPYIFVDVLNVSQVSIHSVFGYYAPANKLGSDTNGKLSAIFHSSVFLPDLTPSAIDKEVHKDDYFDWSEDHLSFQYGTYEPSASVDEGYQVIFFRMNRANGRYVETFTPEGRILDGEIGGLVAYSDQIPSEAGQCVQVPNSKTLEQMIQASGNQR